MIYFPNFSTTAAFIRVLWTGPESFKSLVDTDRSLQPLAWVMATLFLLWNKNRLQIVWILNQFLFKFNSTEVPWDGSKIHQGTNIHIHMYVSENESILDSNKMEEKLGQNMTQVLDKWRFRIEYLYRRMGKAWQGLEQVFQKVPFKLLTIFCGAWKIDLKTQIAKAFHFHVDYWFLEDSNALHKHLALHLCN